MKQLSNIELDKEFAVAVKTERKITHEVLLFIQEINRRSLHISFGYRDLRTYLIQRHHYSDGAAWRRISAMQMLMAVPEIEEKIIDGALNLSQLAFAQSAINKKQREEKVMVSEAEKSNLLKELEHKSVEETKVELANALNVEIEEKKAITYGKKNSVYINLKFTKEEFATIKQCLNLLSHQAKDHKELYLKLCKKVIQAKTNPRAKTMKSEEEQIVEEARNKEASQPKTTKDNPNTNKTRMRFSKEVRTTNQTKNSIASPQKSKSGLPISPTKKNENEKAEKLNSNSSNKNEFHINSAKQEVFRPGRPEKNPLMDGRSKRQEDPTKNEDPQAIQNQTQNQKQHQEQNPKITHQNFAAKSKRSRYLIAPLRSQVFRRDEYMCRFIGEDGHMCGSTRLLQLHHIIPFAKGGQHSLENLSLRCRKHNLFEAEKEGLTIF